MLCSRLHRMIICAQASLPLLFKSILFFMSTSLFLSLNHLPWIMFLYKSLCKAILHIAGPKYMKLSLKTIGVLCLQKGKAKKKVSMQNKAQYFPSTILLSVSEFLQERLLHKTLLFSSPFAILILVHYKQEFLVRYHDCMCSFHPRILLYNTLKALFLLKGVLFAIHVGKNIGLLNFIALQPDFIFGCTPW